MGTSSMHGNHVLSCDCHVTCHTPTQGHRNQSERGDGPEAMEGAVQPLEPKSTSLFRIEHRLVPSYIPLRIIEKVSTRVHLGKSPRGGKSMLEDILGGGGGGRCV